MPVNYDKIKKVRLKWNSSLDAQKQADTAFDDFKLKKKLKHKSKSPKMTKKKLQDLMAKHKFSSKDYQDYRETAWWKMKRKQKMQSSGYKCEQCGSNKGLNVHHNNYESLYRELHSDLTLLCSECHRTIHNVHDETFPCDSIKQENK